MRCPHFFKQKLLSKLNEGEQKNSFAEKINQTEIKEASEAIKIS